MPQDALYQQDFLVLSNEADIHHRASMYSLCNYLQEAARSHAENLGWGITQLRNQHQFWVLTRLIVAVEQYPKPGQTVTVSTWPKGTDRLFALRDFNVFLENTPIARATSAWALLDLKTRRPNSLTAMDAIMHKRAHIHAIAAVPEKLHAATGNAQTFTHTVTYSELDVNGHVNNTRYINWLLDTFTLAFHKEHSLGAIQLNYLAEVFPDQTIHIHRQQTGLRTFLFEITNTSDKALFRALLTFT